MKQKYQVIIVGAGPAGSTLAYHLAKGGVHVLLLDRAVFPRYKCCAGGLTFKAATLLDMPIELLVDDTVLRVDVSFSGNSTFLGQSGEPLMYTIKRETFDHALLQRAQEVGVTVLQNTEAKAARTTKTRSELVTTAGNFSCDFIAGADGAGSLVAKAMGTPKQKTFISAIEAEVKVDEDNFTTWKSRIKVDIGRVRGGYGWVFPKSDHLSLGIACLATEVKSLRGDFEAFLGSLHLGRYTILNFSHGMLPVCERETVVTRGRALLVGDAAGLADPLTGEGIYSALLSARLAADSIREALAKGGNTLDGYSHAVASLIVPNMKIAASFMKVLSFLPAEIFSALNRDDKVWKAWCKLMRGEMDYVTLKSSVSSLGKLVRLIIQV